MCAAPHAGGGAPKCCSWTGTEIFHFLSAPLPQQLIAATEQMEQVIRVGDEAAALMAAASSATMVLVNELRGTCDRQRTLASSLERVLQHEVQAVASPFVRAMSVLEQHGRLTMWQLPDTEADVAPRDEVSCERVAYCTPPHSSTNLASLSVCPTAQVSEQAASLCHVSCRGLRMLPPPRRWTQQHAQGPCTRKCTWRRSPAPPTKRSWPSCCWQCRASTSPGRWQLPSSRTRPCCKRPQAARLHPPVAQAAHTVAQPRQVPMSLRPAQHRCGCLRARLRVCLD